MRAIGLVLVVLGFAMLPASCFYLFGSTFAPEGRSMLERAPLAMGAPGGLRFRAAPGKRYRASISFMVRPEGFPVKDGAYVLDYAFPYSYTLTGADGAIVQHAEGAVAKGEPDVGEHGTSTQVLGDVVIQRWFDWFEVPSESVVTLEARVDEDRLAKAKVRAAHLELWDDTARKAQRGFWAMGASMVVFLSGVGLLLGGQLRLQRGARR